MAKSVRIPRTGSPRRALTQLTSAGATGALHIGTEDCIYLVNGSVVFAESGSSPSIGDLLTASDRLAPQTWLAALATGGAVGKADVRPPAWLVQQGHLTHGELELCVLGAIYDAAYFALGSASALLRFIDGETHGMGSVTSVDPAVLAREVARRRKLLDEIYHEPGVDHAVIVPVRRPPVPRVVLSALQWEIVGRADGTLNPIGLAKELGRAGYAVLTEVRRLAAAGLIALPAGAIPLVVRNAPIAQRPAPLIPWTEQMERSDVATGLARVDPAAALNKPAVALGNPAAALRSPSASLGNPGASLGNPAASLGNPAASLGNPAASLGNPAAALGDAGMPRRRTPVAPERSEAFDDAALPIRAAVPAPAPPGSLPALPRRAPGERLPEMTEEPLDVAAPVPADEALLKRIRTALKALR
ncbi:hypothetical protein Ais01nite_66600 [Asanoa ishikariensis]|uniref:Uncharacterized protein n=1 Tax=Asanoa ishikariensis TaxID=137265 RepID=A0A1H3NGU5_9ACTN|nr:hypothetical protein [Asanoa ishikariensis]GIF68625.1 hypothetical protein Ais01nite_66600 [Asanoa ishikariensis]SDY88117.1 hypothetical protein SAMN05421684_2066 [Asanoa ishikariensis]